MICNEHPECNRCVLCKEGVGLHLVCGTCLNEKCGQDRDVHGEKLGVAVTALKEVAIEQKAKEDLSGNPAVYWAMLAGKYRGLARKALAEIERKSR